MKLTIFLLLGTAAALCGEPSRTPAKVLPGQRIIMIGDSVTKGKGFGNYEHPSPLNRLYDMAALLLQDNVSQPPPVVRITCGWEGLNADGTKIGATDSLETQMKYCVERGDLRPGDWLIYEDAGQVDIFIHPAPQRIEKGIYTSYRKALREMVLAAEPAVSRDHFVMMTMFDYGPACKWCQWDVPLDDGKHTGNDVFRDTAAEMGTRIIDMNASMDAAHAYTVSHGWGQIVYDKIHPNMYGNYVMVLAILNALGYNIANWNLSALENRFRHPAAGGDVAEVPGFTKDPTDAERIVLLAELRRIVLQTAKH